MATRHASVHLCSHATGTTHICFADQSSTAQASPELSLFSYWSGAASQSLPSAPDEPAGAAQVGTRAGHGVYLSGSGLQCDVMQAWQVTKKVTSSMTSSPGLCRSAMGQADCDVCAAYCRLVGTTWPVCRSWRACWEMASAASCAVTHAFTVFLQAGKSSKLLARTGSCRGRILLAEMQLEVLSTVSSSCAQPCELCLQRDCTWLT